MTQRFTYPNVRAQVTEAEWNARVELAAFYRVVAHYRMTDLTANHITLRVPDAPDHFLINPFGLYYEEITASSLLKIDREGKILIQPDSNYGLNYTGFVIHGAIHDARPELNCIIHTHTQAGVAISAMQGEVMMCSQSSMLLDGKIGYHEFEGIALDLGERERLSADLGQNNVLILRNHGLLACGRTVAETFVYIYQLEMACRTQLQIMAAGAKINPISPAAAEATRKAFGMYTSSGAMGRFDWAAELRRLDRNDPSYRD